jgi:hypothetical protein
LPVILASAGLCPAAEAPKSEPTTRGAALDKRYIDPLNGFSLRPPADTDRRREYSPTIIVTWSKRDEKTGAIAWSLTVQKATESNRHIELKAYAEALKRKLSATYKIESVDLGVLAGKAAIHLRGLAGADARLYQRQAWVMARAGEFLVFAITGPQDAKDQLEKVFDAVMETLQLTDPRKAVEESKENVARGKEVLAGVKDKQLAAAVAAEPQWFLLQLKNEDVGFMVQKEVAAKCDGENGYEVRCWVVMQLAKDKPRVLRRMMFTTPDRTFEKWTEKLEIGAGRDGAVVLEEGLKQMEMIVCNITADGKSTPHKKQAPQEFYLPKVMGVLLPRLLDLSKPTAYAFAAYNGMANNFDMRTFAVVGPETITLGGKKTEAIKASDQSAADAEAATVWLDAKGMLLRMTTPDGLLMEAAPKSLVLQRHAKAEELTREIGR